MSIFLRHSYRVFRALENLSLIHLFWSTPKRKGLPYYQHHPEEDLLLEIPLSDDCYVCTPFTKPTKFCCLKLISVLIDEKRQPYSFMVIRIEGIEEGPILFQVIVS